MIQETNNAPQRLAELRGFSETLLIHAMCQDESEVVRHEAAFLLGDIQSTGALEALISASHDPSILVCHEVALALANFRCARSVVELVRLAADPSPDVSRSAVHALVEMVTIK